MKICIIGAGSWGSALAIAFSSIADISLFSHNKAQVQQINKFHTNEGYLPQGIAFQSHVVATDDFDSIHDVDLFIIATPISALREMLLKIRQKHYNVQKEELKKITLPDIIWVCKGFEAITGLLPHQVFKEVFGDSIISYGALLGPSFAADVVHKLPTAITLTGNDLDFIFKWIKIFKPIENFRIYANQDIIGASIGAGVKNIIAIATGIVDGLHLGLNARAALITRSLSELSRLIIALGGCESTVYGLTGIGDLILTCTGDLSRNRQVGLQLATGKSLVEITSTLGHVAEGVATTKEVYHLGKKLKISMPIIDAVYNVIYLAQDVKSCIYELLSRESKLEFIK